MSGPRTLHGVVRLRDAAPRPGSLRIKVEDVSRADAAARVVAEVVLPLGRALAAGATVPFSVTVPELDESARYGVRVHIDCNGSGQVDAGDLISTQSYPVLTQGNRDSVDIEVRAI